MAQRQNMTTILRLMCLLSFCNSGISASDYDRLKHQFLQTYGFDKLMAFNTLKRTGLLTSREALVALKASVQGKDKPSSTSFLQVAKKLGLNVGQNQSVVASSQMQEDVSYVFNGANTSFLILPKLDSTELNMFFYFNLKWLFLSGCDNLESKSICDLLRSNVETFIFESVGVFKKMYYILIFY